MRSSKCSVIIPTYNHAEFIERSINSALRQTYSDFEVIVVDDGSTDDTAGRLEKFGDRIIYHKKANGGLGAARNSGILISSGEYLQFLDADDLIEPEKLESQVKVLEANRDVALVYSDCRNTDFDGNPTVNISYELNDGEDPMPILVHRVLTSLNACLTRREAVIDIGMFDECRHAQEDWDYAIRLRLKGYRFKYSPGDFVHYDQTGSRMTNNSALMYKRARHLLEKFINDREFQKLDPAIVKDFVAHQNFQLATRAYNNGWWKRARRHFIAAILANPRVVETKSWGRLPASILRQVYDVIRGRMSSEAADLDA